MRIRLQIILVCVTLLAPFAAAQHGTAAAAAASFTLVHVHGLAYSADGKELMVPSHHGLAIYRDGKWSKAPGPAHDYMGFAAARARLYSSGHPAPDTGLINPFGLIRSADGGKTWDKLGLDGESDFHLLAVSWNTNAVYVWNHERNSRMPSAGIYFTLNDGIAWQRAAAKGLSGTPRALAVHPDDARIVSVATSTGIFLSRNSGESFEPVAAKGQGLTACFDLDGKNLWHSSHDGIPRLARTPLQGGASTAATLPALTNDAVAYVAQNPAHRKEYAMATFERSVFVSRDAGKTWKQIARDGKGL